MGYLSIENLYKRPDLLEVFALEKVDGTSAHVSFDGDKVHFSSGGASHANFLALFDEAGLKALFTGVLADSGAEPGAHVTVFGEAFGGKLQGMSDSYGKGLRFVAFDVRIGGTWLDVPSAEAVAKALGLDFVPYDRGPMTIEWLDSQRDRDSLVAVKPGCIREGVVIRPVYETTNNAGHRTIAKYKRKEFTETKTFREVDPSDVQVLSDAKAVADEWVTANRLGHVLQKVPFGSMADTGGVVRAMVEDVRKESAGEIVWSREAERAIGAATVRLLKAHVSRGLVEA